MKQKSKKIDAIYPLQLISRKGGRLDALHAPLPPPPKPRSRPGLILSFFRASTATVMISMLILVQARMLDAFEAHVVNVTAEIHQINVPTATPPGGTFTESVQVELAVEDLTDGPLTIHYTDDGSAPDCNSLEYTTPLTFTTTTTLKAVACDTDNHQSIILEDIYTIEEPPPAAPPPPTGGQTGNVEGEILFAEEFQENGENPLIPSLSEPPLVMPAAAPDPPIPADMPDLPTIPTSTPEFPPMPTIPAVPTTTPELPDLPNVPDLFPIPIPTTTPSLPPFPTEVPASIPTTTPEFPALPRLPEFPDTFSLATSTTTSTTTIALPRLDIPDLQIPTPTPPSIPRSDQQDFDRPKDTPILPKIPELPI